MDTVYRACRDVTVVYSLKDPMTHKRVPVGATKMPVCSGYALSAEGATSQLDQVINARCDSNRKRLSCQKSGVVTVESETYAWRFLTYLRLLVS